MVLAARSAHFTAAYGMVGLSPDGGMSWLLPRLIGMRRAQAMIIGNQRVSANEPEAIGLVTRTVADAALLSEGPNLAEKLTSSATEAIGAERALQLEIYDVQLKTQLAWDTRRHPTMRAKKDSIHLKST